MRARDGILACPGYGIFRRTKVASSFLSSMKCPPACSRAHERAATSGLPGPPGRHPQGCRAGMESASWPIQVRSSWNVFFKIKIEKMSISKRRINLVRSQRRTKKSLPPYPRNSVTIVTVSSGWLIQKICPAPSISRICAPGIAPAIRKLFGGGVSTS